MNQTVSQKIYAHMTTVARPPVIPVGTLYPCCACLCCMNSLVCESFDCVGFYSRDACCCIQVDNYCCKYTREPGYDCIVYRSECMKGDCRSCCQVSRKLHPGIDSIFLLSTNILLYPLQTEKQFCCFDFRCQDRKTEEQPCICTMLFFTVSMNHGIHNVFIVVIVVFYTSCQCSATLKTNGYALVLGTLTLWKPLSMATQAEITLEEISRRTDGQPGRTATDPM